MSYCIFVFLLQHMSFAKSLNGFCTKKAELSIKKATVMTHTMFQLKVILPESNNKKTLPNMDKQQNSQMKIIT